jgi:hypothetical protein
MAVVLVERNKIHRHAEGRVRCGCAVQLFNHQADFGPRGFPARVLRLRRDCPPKTNNDEDMVGYRTTFRSR